MESNNGNMDLLVCFPIHISFQGGRKRIIPGAAPHIPAREPGRMPRITRLMALALHLQNLINRGVVKDYAQIASRFGLTRARVTQIMNLTMLAPEIQEEIIFLPRIMNGKDGVTERSIRRIASEPDWSSQMKEWAKVVMCLRNPHIDI